MLKSILMFGSILATAVAMDNSTTGICRDLCGKNGSITRHNMFQMTGNDATCCEQIRCASEVYTPVVHPYDSQGSVTIPKILHTIEIYPEGFKKAKLIEQVMEIQYAMAKVDGWSVMSWGFEDATSLIASKYSFFLPLWQEIEHWRGGNLNIARSDIFRNFALHAYGGLYLDSDIILCRTTLNDLVKDQW
jgi:hypothetical protein